AAKTNQIALIVSPRTIAIMAQATAPTRATATHVAIFAGVQRRSYSSTTWGSTAAGGSSACSGAMLLIWLTSQGQGQERRARRPFSDGQRSRPGSRYSRKRRPAARSARVG